MVNQLFQTLRVKLLPVWVTSRTVILTSAVVTAAVLGMRQMGLLQPLELAGFDQLVRLRPEQKPDPRLLIVGITDDDIRLRGEYPLTDQTVLKLLQKLEQAEPRAIGLDMIRDVPIGQGQKQLLEYMGHSDRLIAVCKVRDETAAGFPPPAGLQLEQVGAANLGVDPDGVLRRAILTITPPALTAANSAGTAPPSLCDKTEEAIPYFGLQLALMYLGVEGIAPEFKPNGDIKLGSTLIQPLGQNVGPYRSAAIGGQQGYQMLINYRAARKVAQEVSLTDVLTGKVNPDLIKDRIVLIGYTARSVKDELFTPYTQGRNVPPIPGVVAHAQVVSQLLSAVLDRQPLFWFWQGWLEGVWILAWSALGGILAWRLRQPIALVLAIGGCLIVLYLVCFQLFTQAGWIPLVPPALAFVITAGGVVLFSRGYAQAIYEGVRGFLQLEIAIDEKKKQEEVEAITNSGYFQEIQGKVAQKKQRKAKGREGTEGTEGAEENTLLIPPPQPEIPASATENNTLLIPPPSPSESNAALPSMNPRRNHGRNHAFEHLFPEVSWGENQVSENPTVENQLIENQVSENRTAENQVSENPIPESPPLKAPQPEPQPTASNPSYLTPEELEFLEQVERRGKEMRRQRPEHFQSFLESLQPAVEPPPPPPDLDFLLPEPLQPAVEPKLPPPPPPANLDLLQALAPQSSDPQPDTTSGKSFWELKSPPLEAEIPAIAAPEFETPAATPAEAPEPAATQPIQPDGPSSSAPELAAPAVPEATIAQPGETGFLERVQRWSRGIRQRHQAPQPAKLDFLADQPAEETPGEPITQPTRIRSTDDLETLLAPPTSSSINPPLEPEAEIPRPSARPDPLDILATQPLSESATLPSSNWQTPNWQPTPELRQPVTPTPSPEMEPSSPVSEPAAQLPEVSHGSLSQLLQEVDEYYQQLKQQSANG